VVRDKIVEVTAGRVCYRHGGGRRAATAARVARRPTRVATPTPVTAAAQPSGRTLARGAYSCAAATRRVGCQRAERTPGFPP
jgi:hypothetical protein